MSRLLGFVRARWLSLTILMIGVITALSLYPLPALPEVAGGDKLHHFIAYAALAFPTALRRPRRAWLFLVGFILFSGLIELIQPYVNRYGEWLDMAANAGGVICGLIAGELVRRIFD